MRLFFLLPAVILSGCGSYTYELQQPDQPPLQITKDAQQVLPVGPVEYHLRRVESRVVVLIYNRDETPLSLDGARSVVVDPGGQSHAIASQLIPPGSFAKLILPPLRDRDPSGPSILFGIGVGARVSAEPSANRKPGAGQQSSGPPLVAAATPRTPIRSHAAPVRAGSSLPATSPIFASANGGGDDFWDWDAGAVRLVLAYRQTKAGQAEETISQQLVIAKLKK